MSQAPVLYLPRHGFRRGKGLAEASLLADNNVMTTYGKYSLTELLGAGPSCDVFQAQETTGLSRSVGMRRLREDKMSLPDQREAFFSMAERWSRVRDDGLVTLLDLDRPLGAMVYELHSQSGSQAIDQAPRPIAAVIQDAKALFGGLEALHQNSLLHLNLKPTNVLYDAASKAKLADGRCILLGRAGEYTPDAPHKYQAPETINRRLGLPGPQSDVYSLAIVLLELLAGQRIEGLFPADSTAPDKDTDWKIWNTDLAKPYLPVADYLENVPPALAAVLDRALQKDPSSRYATAAEVLRDLAQIPTPEDPNATATKKPSKASQQQTPTPASESEPVADQPLKLEDIPDRPSAPVILRFVGCEAEMVGLSTDFFVIGDMGDCEVPLPPEMRGNGTVRLRFSRGSDGWRVSSPEDEKFLLNQQLTSGLTPLKSGDVIRLRPGAPGVQFTILHQNAESLAKLASTYAPRLIQAQPKQPDTPAPAANLDDTGVGKQVFFPNTQQQPPGQSSKAVDAPVLPVQSAGWSQATKNVVLLVISIIVVGVVALVWPTGPTPPPAETTPVQTPAEQ